jgi:hypothetical protein
VENVFGENLSKRARNGYREYVELFIKEQGK